MLTSFGRVQSQHNSIGMHNYLPTRSFTKWNLRCLNDQAHQTHQQYDLIPTVEFENKPDWCFGFVRTCQVKITSVSFATSDPSKFMPRIVHLGNLTVPISLKASWGPPFGSLGGSVNADQPRILNVGNIRINPQRRSHGRLPGNLAHRFHKKLRSWRILN